MFTREQYVKGECDHRTFYGQFVNEKLRRFVHRLPWFNAIMESNDPYFNDTTMLSWWDILSTSTPAHIDLNLWRELVCPQYKGTATYAWSLSDNICILKEVARQLKEEKLACQIS